MTQEERFSRLEIKVDRLQDQAHANHLEILSCISKANDQIDDEVNVLKMKVDRHESYFGMVLKAMGLGGVAVSWLGLKEIIWPSK